MVKMSFFAASISALKYNDNCNKFESVSDGEIIFKLSKSHNDC